MKWYWILLLQSTMLVIIIRMNQNWSNNKQANALTIIHGKVYTHTMMYTVTNKLAKCTLKQWCTQSQTSWQSALSNNDVPSHQQASKVHSQTMMYTVTNKLAKCILRLWCTQSPTSWQCALSDYDVHSHQHAGKWTQPRATVPATVPSKTWPWLVLHNLQAVLLQNRTEKDQFLPTSQEL